MLFSGDSKFSDSQKGTLRRCSLFAQAEGGVMFRVQSGKKLRESLVKSLNKHFVLILC